MNPGFYTLVGPNAAGKTHYLHTLMSPQAAFVPAGADTSTSLLTASTPPPANRSARD